jgi:hypothetical protein
VGADAALRLAALVAGSYAISGGSDYTDAIHRVADELDLTLPDLLARGREPTSPAPYGTWSARRDQ